MIKVAFLGTPYIGAAALKSLIDNDKIEVVVAVTGVDKPIGRSHSTLVPTPVSDLASAHGIPIIKTESINKDIDLLKKFEFDYMLTCAFGQFLSDDVLALSKKKPLNIHGSLLPEGRGGAPIHWAIIEGKKKTGISIMEMVSEMDAGDYYSQYEIDIDENETGEELFNRMSELILDKAAEGLIAVENGAPPTKQDKSKVTFWMNVKRDDVKIDFTSQSSERIHNLIRAATPKPGAWGIIEGKIIKLVNSSLSTNKSNGELGQIVKIDDSGAHIKTIDNDLIVKEVTIEGSKKLVLSNENGQNILNLVIK